MSRPERPLVGLDAVHGFARSNSTSNFFLGAPQRSWMTGTVDVGDGATARSQASFSGARSTTTSQRRKSQSNGLGISHQGTSSSTSHYPSVTSNPIPESCLGVAGPSSRLLTQADLSSTPSSVPSISNHTTTSPIFNQGLLSSSQAIAPGNVQQPYQPVPFAYMPPSEPLRFISQFDQLESTSVSQLPELPPMPTDEIFASPPAISTTLSDNPITREEIIPVPAPTNLMTTTWQQQIIASQHNELERLARERQRARQERLTQMPQQSFHPQEPPMQQPQVQTQQQPQEQSPLQQHGQFRQQQQRYNPTSQVHQGINPESGRPNTDETGNSAAKQASFLALRFIRNPDEELLNFIMQTRVTMQGRNILKLLDENRYGLLIEACRQRDSRYLLLHQLYCLNTVSPYLLSSILPASAIQNLAALDDFLLPNDSLSTQALQFFASQPVPISELQNCQLSGMLAGIEEGLRMLRLHWQRERMAALTRGYPLCAGELHQRLKMVWPIIQGVLFTSLHRQLCEADSVRWEQASRALFFANRTEYLRKIERAGVHDITADVRAFGEVYRTMREKFQNGQPLPAPLLRYLQNLPIPNFGSSQPLPSPSQMISPVLPPQTRPASRSTIATSSAISFPPSTNLSSQAPAQYHSPSSRMVASAALTRPSRPSFTMIPARQTPTKTPLLPRANFVLPQMVNPRPNRMALHQAHLMSPKAQTDAIPGADAEAGRLYQQMEDLILSPQVLDAENSFQTWKFFITPDLLKERVLRFQPENVKGTGESRLFSPGKVLFRLRSVESWPEKGPDQFADWSSLPTKWPNCVFISANKCLDLEVRRKSHWGKDLAADLTDIVVAGENSITVSSYWHGTDAFNQFHFAVESIRIYDHQTLLRKPGFIATHVTLAALTKVLHTNDEDDDLVAVDEFVSIDTKDPFTSVLWTTPVRSRSCLHRECFDLEPYLLSRTSRQPGGPSNPDEWKCPICGKDARPTQLMIDSYLLGIRQEMEQNGQLSARSILVKRDGSWSVRLDEADDPDTTEKSDGNGNTEMKEVTDVPTQAIPPPVPQSEPIVIDLDDDDDD